MGGTGFVQGGYGPRGPACFPTCLLGVPGIAQAPLSFFEFTEFFVRAKKLTFTWDLNGHTTGTDTLATCSVRDDDTPSNNIAPPSEELAIACALQEAGGYTSATAYKPSTFVAFRSTGMSGTYYDSGSDTYALAANLDIVDNTDVSRFVTTNPSGAFGPSAFSFSFLGHSILMYDSTATANTGSASIVIEEWWPYVTAVGQVWDTATGAQLIDPAPQGF